MLSAYRYAVRTIYSPMLHRRLVLSLWGKIYSSLLIDRRHTFLLVIQVVCHTPVFPAYSQLPTIFIVPPNLFFSRWQNLRGRHSFDQPTCVDWPKDSAPLKLPTKYCFLTFLLWRLEYTLLKNGISLTDQVQPKSNYQILPSMLRIKNVYSILSCSKAPGVFSSNCR